MNGPQEQQNTNAKPVPAAALVVDWIRSHVWNTAGPIPGDAKLVPIQAVDFFKKDEK